MRLYLVRHGEPDEPVQGEDDYEENPDPPITEEAEEQVAALAAWMIDKDEVPNFILASPMLRTQQTAEILRDAFGLPSVESKGSLGPNESIRKMVLKVALDPSYTRVMMVTHHETIAHGLRVLNLEPWAHFDMFAQGELRIFRVDRKDQTWEEHRRMMPSDFGFPDHY